MMNTIPRVTMKEEAYRTKWGHWQSKELCVQVSDQGYEMGLTQIATLPVGSDPLFESPPDPIPEWRKADGSVQL